MKTEIGITESHRKSVAAVLCTLLADETVLYTKTKNAHWNVEGPDFYDNHTFFDSQIAQIDQIIDSLAERIRTLGHYAPATLKAYLQMTHLTESSGETNKADGFIAALLADHVAVISSIREQLKHISEKYQDAGSADFVTGLMESHEKMAWFLRAHLDN